MPIRHTRGVIVIRSNHELPRLAPGLAVALVLALAPAVAAGHVVLCSALLLLKTLCRAHYKLIIPVPSCAFYHAHTPTHTFAHSRTAGSIWLHRATDRHEPRGAQMWDIRLGAWSRSRCCHMPHIRRSWNIYLYPEPIENGSNGYNSLVHMRLADWSIEDLIK